MRAGLFTEFFLGLIRQVGASTGADRWTYAYTGMFESIRQGRWAATTDAVTELTGSGPVSLRDVLNGGSPGQEPRSG
ncbi:hypothetical protein ABZ570_21405 [Micromonospora sp. NPDC007271]|uniref:hypothetical protein n=1 Tax=Micromonospora sp. NPDC007271 TaxID=3154587 RepID=UPI0034016508